MDKPNEAHVIILITNRIAKEQNVKLAHFQICFFGCFNFQDRFYLKFEGRIVVLAVVYVLVLELKKKKKVLIPLHLGFNRKILKRSNLEVFNKFK